MNYRTILIYTFFTFILFFVISCSGDKPQLSISEEKLQKVLFDLYAADNVLKDSPKEIRDSLKIVYTKQIFQIHNLNQKEFEQNLTLLQKNPQQFKKFYDKLDHYAEEMSREKTDDKIPKDKK